MSSSYFSLAPSLPSIFARLPLPQPFPLHVSNCGPNGFLWTTRLVSRYDEHSTAVPSRSSTQHPPRFHGHHHFVTAHSPCLATLFGIPLRFTCLGITSSPLARDYECKRLYPPSLLTGEVTSLPPALSTVPSQSRCSLTLDASTVVSTVDEL